MASIAPLNQILGTRLAKHLLRRATFRYNKQDIDLFASMTVDAAVDQLFVPTTDPIPEPQDPEDSNNVFWIDHYSALNRSPPSDGRKRHCMKAYWVYNALQLTSIRHKMILFLHNQFTINITQAGPSYYYYDYLKLLDFYSFGSIKDLALKMTYSSAMLIYLDNRLNSRVNPNENYARELLELFTIGKGPQIGPGNYTTFTEADVVETAKVLTGLSDDRLRSRIDSVTNIPEGYVRYYGRHDNTDKTFSSAFGGHTITGATPPTGPTDPAYPLEVEREMRDLIAMIFNQTATHQNICRRLYRFFVRDTITTEIETDIIAPMVATLVANNFQLEPVVKQLLKSQHFYDKDDVDATDEIIGGMIKSPLQLLTDTLTLFEIPIPDPQTDPTNYYVEFGRRFLATVYFPTSGMDLFSPSTVAGYAAYYQAPNYSKYWFDASTIISRYKLIESFINNRNAVQGTNRSIQAPLDVVAFFANSTIFTNRPDPTVVVQDLVDHLFPENIDQNRLTYFVNDIFLGAGMMAYNWTSAWNDYLITNDDSVVRPRLEDLFIALVNAPEFQTY